MVVFGNRRLKALKRVADETQQDFRVPCIVHDLSSEAVPPPLVAKFLSACTTRNKGRSAPYRE